MHESDGGNEPVRHRLHPDDPATPLQLGDIQADDALIDALGAGTLRATDELATSDDVDDRLAAMLASWVAAVQEPGAPRDAALAAAASAAPAAVADAGSADETRVADIPIAASTTAVDGHVPRHRRRHDRPNLVVRLSAAAVIAIAVTGGIAVGNADTARPGDVLWPVAKVFYREHARSVEAADTVSVHLERARTALREGRTADAAREVNDMQAALAVILPADGRAALDSEHTAIVAIVAATPDAALLDPQLRAPAVPDVAGAVALGLPRAPGLPDPSTPAGVPTEALQATVPPVTSSGPSTSGTSEVPPVVTQPVEPPPPATEPPVEPPTDTAPVEPPPYIPPYTDPPAVDPGPGTNDDDDGTDNGVQSQAPTEAPATTEPPAEQPVAAGSDTTPADTTPGDTGSGSAESDPVATDPGAADPGSTDPGTTGSDTTGSAQGASDTGSGDQSGTQPQDSNGSLLSVSAEASLGVGGTPVSGTLGLSLG